MIGIQENEDEVKLYYEEVKNGLELQDIVLNDLNYSVYTSSLGKSCW
jgi:hypothetical protein